MTQSFFPTQNEVNVNLILVNVGDLDCILLYIDLSIDYHEGEVDLLWQTWRVFEFLK